MGKINIQSLRITNVTWEQITSVCSVCQYKLMVLHTNAHNYKQRVAIILNPIRRRSDYTIGFIAPAIGPNKSKKLTRLIAPTHNIPGKV